jgi:hypothetical protein
MTDQQKNGLRQVLAEYRPDEFHHGDFVGADAEAHGIVKEDYPATRVVIHPRVKKTFRAFCQGDEQRPTRGYLARNRELIATCDMLAAAPKSMEDQQMSGTWAVIRYARIRSVAVVVLNPEADGGRARSQPMTEPVRSPRI